MSVIVQTSKQLCDKISEHAVPVLQKFLSRAFVETVCREAKYSWRERGWPPLLTLLACIHKQLACLSARQIEDWACGLGETLADGVRDGHAFCMARIRLPLEVFARALWHLGTLASNEGAWVWRGKRVLIIDGTTLRTPHTAKNIKAFGQSDNGRKKSHFPLVRMVALICAGAGSVLDVALGDYANSEMRMVRSLIERLESGALLVLDAGFSSFMLLWLAQQRKCDVLARHHHTRKGDFVKKLGDGDEIHLWKKPKKPRVTWIDLLAATPQSILVRVITFTVVRRGYRDLELKLCTTLLDAELHPAHELVTMYMQRWNIEVDLRTLKSGYGLARVTGQSEQVVMKEIYSTLIAYNAVQLLMTQSGEMGRNLSHARSRALLCEFCARMSSAPTVQLPGLFKLLLALIAATKIDRQERPPQPRNTVQRQTTFHELTITRQQWLQNYHLA
jgi:putative transposase